MVRHPDGAQKVLDEMGEWLPNEDRSVSSLLNIVSGEVAGRSDLIEIIATHGNPVLPAEIANTWSSAYVDQVNAVYSGGETPDAYRAIKVKPSKPEKPMIKPRRHLNPLLLKIKPMNSIARSQNWRASWMVSHQTGALW
ncbi:MAG: hypothetical protein KAS38_15040 [Anaerolineales bacterium]|nr:hypothetical protein [Anaerolineales bacterium]